MPTKKVLFLDTNHPHLKLGLEALGYQCDEDYHSDKKSIQDIIHQYTGIVIRSRFKIDREFLDTGQNLEFIARVGAGLESVDIAYAEERNVILIAAPEGNRNAVGEHALGMILSLFNKIKVADEEIRHGLWRREENRGVELEGKTVGIIGYGHMGKSFAKKLKGFDCNVICFDIKPDVGDENARQVDLEELFRSTQVLSLHTPHTVLTNRMVDYKFINSFKQPFYCINTARGSAIVTSDLVKALKSGQVLGACLDVLEYEKSSFEHFFSAGQQLPQDFQYLINSDRVLLSPHVAGWTIESKFKLADTIVKKVAQLKNN